MDRTYAHKQTKRNVEVLPGASVDVEFENGKFAMQSDTTDDSESNITRDALGSRALAAFLLLAALLTLVGVVSVIIYFLILIF